MLCLGNGASACFGTTDLWGSVSLLGRKSSLDREGLQRHGKGAMEKLIWVQNSAVVWHWELDTYILFEPISSSD